MNAPDLAGGLFLYEHLRNQWAILAVAGGLILLLSVALSVIALSRPRREVQREEVQPYSKSFAPYVPWILWGTYIVLLGYMAFPFFQAVWGKY